MTAGELAGRDFIAGDHYSIADITATVATDFMKPARIAIPDDVPNFTRWYEAMKARGWSTHAMLLDTGSIKILPDWQDAETATALTEASASDYTSVKPQYLPASCR